MRVLHVIPSVSESSGGPSKAIVQMEQSLLARGVEVVTVTTNDDGNTRISQPLAGSVHSLAVPNRDFRHQLAFPALIPPTTALPAW